MPPGKPALQSVPASSESSRMSRDVVMASSYLKRDDAFFDENKTRTREESLQIQQSTCENRKSRVSYKNQHHCRPKHRDHLQQSKHNQGKKKKWNVCFPFLLVDCSRKATYTMYRVEVYWKSLWDWKKLWELQFHMSNSIFYVKKKIEIFI